VLDNTQKGTITANYNIIIIIIICENKAREYQGLLEDWIQQGYQVPILLYKIYIFKTTGLHIN
jgi:hypothetical protein